MVQSLAPQRRGSHYRYRIQPGVHQATLEGRLRTPRPCSRKPWRRQFDPLSGVISHEAIREGIDGARRRMS